MDNTSPSPPKRPRTIDFLTSQLGQPVRYFPFKEKQSGITQQEKLTRIDRVQTIKGQHVVTSTIPAVPFSSNMKFVPNKEANISNKLQKLKLKSPDGRDLGEINVQLLPQKGEGIGGKTIMLQKHSLFGKLDNSSAVSILKPIEKNKQTTTISGIISVHQTNTSHGSLVNNGTNCVLANNIHGINTVKEIGSTKPILSVKQKIESHHVPLILRHSDIPKYSPASLGSKVIFINVDKQTGLNTVKSVNNDSRNPASNQKIIVVHAENYPDSTEGKKNNGLSTATELRPNLFSKDDSSTELASSTSNIRTIPSVFWNPSKFSDLTSKISNQKNRTNESETVKSVDKPMMIVSQSLDSEQTKSVSKSITLSTNTLHKKLKPKLNSWTIVKTSNRKLENSILSSSEVDDKKSPKNSVEISRITHKQNVTVCNSNYENSQNVTSTTNNILHTVDSKECNETVDVNTQNDNSDERSNSDKNLRENIMVILHGDMNTLQNSEKKSSDENESNNQSFSMEIDASTEIPVNQTHDGNSVEMNAEILDSNTNPIQLDDSNKQNLLSKQQDLDIIKKALSSCTDQELRNKALKALADCGIGDKREVPVAPKVSVSDSITQTTLFSLLKPEMLVECSDNSPILSKVDIVKSIEKTSQYPCGVTPFNESNCFNLSADPLLPDDILMELDDLLSEDSRKDVNQMKDIFLKPNPIISQTFVQIQRDFQAATTVDANGMMGIHRAVLSDNIKEVQRQLIVLKAVKESIEVPTGDGKTSLELAVLHDVDPQIVNILLAAGAKPAIPIKLHESALIIASRTASDVLPELIKHTTPSSLLDIVDSEGFAPLHYCAQLGNLKGVKALVSAGALVNLKDAKSGRTALFHALESRNIEMAYFLVENGASPNIINFAGQSPAALVDECRHNSLAEKFNQAVR